MTSLNGEPEPGVVVEAVGEGQDCQQYQEEAKTEQDGSYRIRGLKVRLSPSETCRHIPQPLPCHWQPEGMSVQLWSVGISPNPHPAIGNLKVCLSISGL